MQRDSEIKELRSHPSWGEYQGYLEGQIRKHMVQLVKIDPNDTAGIAMLQGRIASLELAISKVTKD